MPESAARTTGYWEPYGSALINPDSADFERLPHGWLTILEAAYEQLDDTEGLRRLFMLHILLASANADVKYVRRLRDLSGDRWPDDVATIVAKARDHRHATLMHDNPAYERLLVEEHLRDATIDYVQGRDRLGSDRFLRMLPALADGDDGSLLTTLTDQFLDRDHGFYHGDARMVASLAAAWLYAVERAFGARPNTRNLGERC